MCRLFWIWEFLCHFYAQLCHPNFHCITPCILGSSNGSPLLLKTWLECPGFDWTVARCHHRKKVINFGWRDYKFTYPWQNKSFTFLLAWNWNRYGLFASIIAGVKYFRLLSYPSKVVWLFLAFLNMSSMFRWPKQFHSWQHRCFWKSRITPNCLRGQKRTFGHDAGVA